MHQGVGLDAFNGWPLTRAVHALYECCYSVPLCADLARGRPYPDHDALFREADALLFALPEETVDTILQAYPCPGCRGDRAELMTELDQTARRYDERFGYGFVMFVGDACAETVLASMSNRLLNDADTERKVVRNELARINRSRLARMLGPEGGFDNW